MTDIAASFLVADFVQTRTDLRHLDDVQLTIQRTAVGLTAFAATAIGVALQFDASIIDLLLAILPLPYFSLALLSFRVFLQHSRLRAFLNFALRRRAEDLAGTHGLWNQEDLQRQHVADLKGESLLVRLFPNEIILPILYAGLPLLAGYAALAATFVTAITGSRDAPAPAMLVAWAAAAALAYLGLTWRVFRYGGTRDRLRSVVRQSQIE